MGHIVDRRLWLTTDKERVVEDGDASAAFLFAGEGDEVSDEDAKRYGLTKSKSRPADKAAERPQDKQATPPANKAR